MAVQFQQCMLDFLTGQVDLSDVVPRMVVVRAILSTRASYAGVTTVTAGQRDPGTGGLPYSTRRILALERKAI